MLGEIVANALDNRLSDEGMVIQERTVTRSVGRQNGRINVTITQKQDLTFIQADFDLQFNDVAHLHAWINVTAANLQQELARIL